MHGFLIGLTLLAFPTALSLTGCNTETSGGAGSGGGGAASGSTTATSSSAGGGTGTAGAGGGLSNGQCHDDSDCPQNGWYCLPPYATQPCGACIDPVMPCMGDNECKTQGMEYICAPALCSCNGESECKPGCSSDNDCEAWAFCAPDYRCTADACTVDADCLADFACIQAGTPHCGRKTCVSDMDCAGYCVLGVCYDVPGTCSLPVP